MAMHPLLPVLLSLAPAHAEPAGDVACFGPTPSASLPEAGATGVPLDVSPIVSFTQDCGTATFSLVLTRGDDGAVIAEAEATVGRYAELVVPEPLAAETAYVLTVTDVALGEEHVIGFTTGTGDAEEAAAPTVSDVAATWTEETGLFEAEAVVTPGGTPVFLSVVDETTGAVVTSGPVDAEAALSWSRGANRPPDEVCVSVEQRDLAGRWTASDVACGEVVTIAEEPEPSLCATGSAAPAGLLALLAGLAGLRRRR